MSITTENRRESYKAILPTLMCVRAGKINIFIKSVMNTRTSKDRHVRHLIVSV